MELRDRVEHLDSQQRHQLQELRSSAPTYRLDAERPSDHQYTRLDTQSLSDPQYTSTYGLDRLTVNNRYTDSPAGGSVDSDRSSR